MRFDVLTIFPGMILSFLQEGVLGRGIKRGLIDVGVVNIRDFALGPHKTTDDRPYGGGEGMVMKPGPIYRALNATERTEGESLTVLLSPQGERFDQHTAWEFAGLKQLVLVCGRYEGVDERIKASVDREVSIGDYILSGGEPAALVLMDAVGRLIPGVLGGERSNLEDTFEDGLLEYPHYTRPRIFQGEEVPPILLSGDHGKIRSWRRKESLKRTFERRPDLLARASLSREDEALLEEIRGAYRSLDRES